MTPENFKIDEQIQDTDSPKGKESESFGVEVVTGQENGGLINKLQQLESAISHDTSVTVGQILDAEKALDSMKVAIGGEEMTIGEMRQIPDLEMNVKIWEEIEGGDFSNMNNLSFITPHIADLLSKYDYGPLYLNGLSSISDEAARCLGRYSGALIYLCGLTTLSDAAAEHIGNAASDEIQLGKLESISDKALGSLSRYKGTIIHPQSLVGKFLKFKVHIRY